MASERKYEESRDEFTGRSLTMREYLERVLFWIDNGSPLGGRDIAPDDQEARLEGLRRCIVDFETRRMLERLADEDWAEIRKSAAGGRWE